MDTKKYQKILKIVLIFVLLQPIFDILSRLAILGYIPNISTYLKPLFVFGMTTYLLLHYSPKRISWLTYISIFIILIIGHTYLLYTLLIDKNVIFHELRFMINILYMISIFIIFDTLNYYTNDKKEMYRKIKKTIFATLIIYMILYIVAIITHTSGLTYEISDVNKLGYKGWYDSGQILGHAYSVVLPLITYIALDPKKKWYLRVLSILLFILTASLLGTRVPYFITIIVFILYLIVTILTKILNKYHKINYFNVIYIVGCIITLIAIYPFTPVKKNMDINNTSKSTSINKYDLKQESGYYNILNEEALNEKYPNQNIKPLIEYNLWSRASSEYLIKLFEGNELHPSNMRYKQIIYANQKYKLSSIKYKIFGLGFLNQDTSLAIESDFTMALYSFGILGFCLFLYIPIKEFIIETFYIIKNLKNIDFDNYLIYMGLGIFFCISIYAGYTYIYTNFSIFLILLIIMSKLKRDITNNYKINTNKISFLMLHLGYGGIETSVINTANALSKEYEVELISFYNLKNNQVSRISKNINIKYLYNGEPNREEFKNAIKTHNYIKALKEGIKAVNILIKKKILIIKEIINNKSKYIISTRYDFTTLLNQYGKNSNIKIAQEHHYHNNNRKYINIIKYKYYNIDYLFALTKTLEEDYHKFLKYNHHTKVELIPNMLDKIPDKKSTLQNKNIITMSRLNYGKKNDDIIKAFSKIKDKSWKLYILGDGDEYTNLSNLIKELKLEDNVFLEGYVKKENIEKYLLNSSIFLMASLTEGLPMVLLEAMSYGIPCIAYETASGVKDIIENNYNGFIIKSRNEKEYINCIDKLTKNQSLREKFGKNAIKTANKFKEEEIIKKWNKVLRSEENVKKSA